MQRLLAAGVEKQLVGLGEAVLAVRRRDIAVALLPLLLLLQLLVGSEAVGEVLSYPPFLLAVSGRVGVGRPHLVA